MKKESIRKLSIALAAILGLGALLYLSGLVAQLLINYEDWLHSGGMTGTAQIAPLQYHPLYCIRHAFTPAGLRAALLILTVGSGVFLFLRLRDRFGGKDLDDRNFVRSKRGTYGTANWMTEKRKKEILEAASPKKARGIILGREENGDVICLPEDTRYNKHVVIYGASGTMKSRGVIRPAIFQSIRRGESVLVSDPKSEIYTDTVELFRKHNYTVRVFNLVQPEFGDSWNAMFNLNGDTLMAQILTDIIIANTKGDNKGDHFWDNGEANLLKALILYVDQDTSRPPEQRNLPAVYQMLTRNTEKQLTAMFERLPVTHPAKASYWLFSQASDTVRTGIVLGLGTRLQVLQNEAICRITRSNDIDLELPGKEKCAYFIILDDQSSSLEFLSSLFFSCLFIKLVRYADNRPDQRCKIPVNIILEEMNNVGVIPDFAKKVSVVRSRSLQIMMCCQSLPQIQNRYPDNLWAELIGNADTQLMLGCTDDISAKYFSERSGDMTVEVNSVMTMRQSIAIAQVIPQYRYTEGLGRRRLLTPDEVLRLPNDELLIIVRSQDILKAKKFDYVDHPFAKEIKKVSIRDYRAAKPDPPVPPIPIPTPAIPSEGKPAATARRKAPLYESSKPPADF